MKNLKNIVILCGGQSGERDVSIKSAEPVFNVLKNLYPTQLIRLDENKLPEGLNADTDLIFPLIHGDFGEDGQLQLLLEQGHFAYLGSDSTSSALCIDKMRSKQLALQHGLPALPGIMIKAGDKLDKALLKDLGKNAYVLKPTDKGSSIGVHLCKDYEELQSTWEAIRTGTWMIEPYVHGRELTVGLLQGKALGAVEIRPKHSFYDFKNKYTAGACEYLFPAPIEEETLLRLQEVAADFFKYAGCLDFGRVDFILEPNGDVWFLEMNTIPGMTSQSLLPKSAACVGMPFEELLTTLIEGARKRF